MPCASLSHVVTTTLAAPVVGPALAQTDGYLDLSVTASGDVWLLAYPKGLYHLVGEDWEWHGLGPLTDRIIPHAIQALDIASPAAGPAPAAPLGAEVWVVGQQCTVARYRALRPTHSVYLPLTSHGHLP